MGFELGGLRISGTFCRGWTRRRLCRRLCRWSPRCLCPVLSSMMMGDLGRGSRSLRLDGRRGRGSVGRIERARVPFGQQLVEVRRCELFGRMLWGDLLMVVVVV